MAPMTVSFVVIHTILITVAAVKARTFIFTNNCSHTVWPATLSGSASPPLSTTGFQLAAGASFSLSAPGNWSGRAWARTNCSTSASGKFSCLSGDCRTGELQCLGTAGSPPASLVEFTLGGFDGEDFYDTSLVDGFNLPIAVSPRGGKLGCSGPTGCAVDLKRLCPAELRASTPEGDVVGCKSACLAFALDEYCCSGEYNDPHKCGPNKYSKFFKQVCPKAYTYPYDDATSTFTCVGADYVINFCPSNNM